MIGKISHTVVYVHDQDEALKFYCDKMGFKKHTDAQFGEMRWLTVQPAQQSDLELVIMKAATEETKALVGKQSPGMPLLCVASSDCQADFEDLSQKGVKFLQEPTAKPWGMEALFVDLYGNIIDMVEPSQMQM